MAIARSRLRLLPAVLVVIAGAACDDSSSLTGPSHGRLASGAIISGRVSGSDAPASDSTRITPPAISRTGSNLLRITIQGTNVSTMADGAGHFTLTNVPLGTVTLLFEDRNVSASITLGNVGVGDNITIDVRLDGTSARVVSFTGTRVGIDDSAR